MSKEEHAQIYEMLSKLFLSVSKGEQIQQCIREVLTSHAFFNPMVLFRYISNDTPVIKKEHLMNFLQENKEEASQDEIKTIIQFQRGKKIWQYTDFLEFIYPYNTAVIRQINQHHLKNYNSIQKCEICQTVVAGFLLLLIQHISLLRKLQIQKGDSQSKISKQRLRKVLLSIKKAGDKQSNHCYNDDTIITSLQLRNFMKAFVGVQESHFLYLSRKLGLKNGSFPIEELQRFIKPRVKSSINKLKQPYPKQQIQKSIQNRQFNQRSYKQQLYEQLSNKVTFSNSKNQQKNNKLKEINSNMTNMQYNNHIKQKLAYNKKQEKTQPLKFDNYYQLEKRSENVRTNTPRELLIKFIQVFLPSARELNDLKEKFSQHKIDYLKLFKCIDKNQRGVISSEDLYEYYYNSGGDLKINPKDFGLVIERYAQSDEPWLTLTQFCEMVKGQEKEGSNRVAARLGEDPQDIIIKILQLNLRNQLLILKIRREFRKDQSKYLFNLINKQQTGFINYQQLKKFLVQAKVNLSMHDLMAVLKRLDRSRNGVIVEQEFVSYFKPPETN